MHGPMNFKNQKAVHLQNNKRYWLLSFYTRKISVKTWDNLWTIQIYSAHILEKYL
jgi:hypothetical protein